MAKRTPRQELRAPARTAPYRREKAAAAPPPPMPADLPPPSVRLDPAAVDAPVATPVAAAAAPVVAAPIAAPVAEAPSPTPVFLDLPMPVAPLPPTTAMPSLPDLIAVARGALGFAAAALAPLPAPTEIVHGDPTAAEPPPGRAPAGDARSFRSDDQFALVYRHGASVISRRGKLGERGAWRVVDYPGPGPAAHAYALECSRLVEQGFRDVV